MNNRPGDSTSDLQPVDPGDDMINVGDLLSRWWERRRFIIATTTIAGVLGLAVVAALMTLSPRIDQANLRFSIDFNGVEQGRYPNGTPFSPADIIAPAIMTEIHERNGLEQLIPLDDFRASFAVVPRSTELEKLQREYAGRLDDRRLTMVDRLKLEDEYASRTEAAKGGEFSLMYLSHQTSRQWPPGLLNKVMDEILATWAVAAQAKGAYLYDMDAFSTNLVPVRNLQEDDYVIAADRLRLTANRVLSNLRDLSELPGARLVRIGESRISIGELIIQVEDLLRFKIMGLLAPIRNHDLYRDRSFTRSYLREQMFRHQLAIEAANRQRELAEQAVVAYQSNHGSANRQESSASGVMGGGTTISQIGESFLDRVIELANQNTDVEFRQELTRRGLSAGEEAVALEREQKLYQELMAALEAAHETAPDTEERKKARLWLENTITSASTELMEVLTRAQELYETISQVNLRPERVYTIMEPPVLTSQPTLSRQMLTLGWFALVGGVFGLTLLGVAIGGGSSLREHGRR